MELQDTMEQIHSLVNALEVGITSTVHLVSGTKWW